MSADRDTPAATAAVLAIEYDGTAFSGWARQPDRRTIEATLLDAFAAIDCRPDVLRCAGRTDAGVHATGQVASVGYDGPVPVRRLAQALSQHLPADLAVRDAVPAPPGFDARADARSRAYVYRVLCARSRSPMRRHRALHHPRALDPELLDACASMICGQHDFTAFTPERTQHRFFHRTILESRWEACGDELRFHVRANAFLRHMVRVLVGTMLAVASGEIDIERFARLLDGAARRDAHRTAPPHGLTLVDVEYPADPFAGYDRASDHRATMRGTATTD